VGDTSEIAVIAALNEPTRRQLYEHVAAQGEPVDRDGAAAAVGVRRSVAAFHLDRLAELGLLEVEYRRPPGRRGPGAGRPAKFYRRASGEVALAIPERHYELAAELLAHAVEASLDEGTSLSEALHEITAARGREIGRQSASTSPTVAIGLREALSSQGYDPRPATDGSITLMNCPFHRLAERHRDLICTMNRDLVGGVCEGFGLPSTQARLDPGPPRCCVRVVPIE
jgi:predicted ArsR family transcriptional regulator